MKKKILNKTHPLVIITLSLLLVAGIFSKGTVVNAASKTALPPAIPPTSPVPANHRPRILNKSLLFGAVNKPYKKVIRIIDVDGDKIKVSVSNLPKGLKPVKKITRHDSKGRTRIYLVIAGRPRQAGVYKVTVTAKDEHRATTRKNLRLVIRSK